jgi:hypothetical protein
MMKTLLVGRYFKVTGVRIERNMIADTIEPITLDKSVLAASVLKQEA